MKTSDSLPVKRSPAEIFVKLCAAVALTLFAAILLCLVACAFTATTDMNTNNPPRERVDYLTDSLWLNLLWLILSLAVLCLIRKLLDRVDVTLLCGICIGITVLFGILWVWSAQGVPMQDSAIVTRAAYRITQGDYSQVTTDYFLRCPYQLGYVFFCEIILRLIPTDGNFLVIQFVNVLLLGLCYVALLRILYLTFQNARAVKLCAVLLTLCLPPVFFCTFTYGNIPALTMGCLGLWQFLAIGAEESRKKDALHATLCALFLGLAVCLKKNSMIFLAAVVIIALLRMIRERNWIHALCVLLAAVASLGLPAAIQAQYEARTDFDFGKGVPMEAWAAMGFYESYIAPGWYESKFVVTNFYREDKDPDRIREVSVEEIQTRLGEFSDDPAYALAFFHEKTVSQWNEPTYQGIWLNQVRGRYGELGPMASLICGEGERGAKAYMNLYQQLILALGLVAAVWLLRRRQIKDALLPTVFLGGFLYHLIFEAKSQYCMIYFLLLIPLAAYGAEELLMRLDPLWARAGLARGKKTSPPPQ